MSIARLIQMARAGVPAGDVWTDPDLANASYDSVSFSVAGQETNPYGLVFSDSGDTLFIVGNSNDQVRQYSLSTAWDVSSATYAQGYSVSAQDTNPLGLAFKLDGTKMYIAGNTNDSVYEYDLSVAWDVSTASFVQGFSVSAEDISPRNLYFKDDGTKMFVIGNSGQDVIEYDLSSPWDIGSSTYSQNFSLSVQETDPHGLFMSPNGESFFVVGRTNDTVYQYNMSTAWDISSASYASDSASVASQETLPQALFFKSDGSKMYIVGGANDTIYQYSTVTPAAPSWTDPDLANVGYDSVSFSVATEDTSPQGLFFKPDGSKVYMVGAAGDDVNEYDLSTAWDVSSASYLQNFSVSAQETTPRAVHFKSDGTKMYVIGSVGIDVNEYDLSSAWDVSTASYSQNFSLSSQDTVPQGLFFKPDGSKMYVVGSTGDNVYEYSLSASWDISSASYVQSFGVSSQDTIPTDLFLSPNGNYFYVIGSSGDAIYEYSLSSDWDISSASYVQSFSISSQEITPTGLFFKSDGSKMYIVGATNDTIYQYST